MDVLQPLLLPATASLAAAVIGGGGSAEKPAKRVRKGKEAVAAVAAASPAPPLLGPSALEQALMVLELLQWKVGIQGVDLTLALTNTN